MKFTLRFTLTAILLTVVFVTIAALGWTSYRNARFTADDLSAQVLEQTSQRVDAQVNDLLRTANRQGQLNLHLLQSGLYEVNDFHTLARYWLDVLTAYPRLTRLSIGLEDSGEWFYVRRLPDGKLAVGELTRNHGTDRLELNDYWPDDYPSHSFFFDAEKTDEDPRLRPWYIAARTARRQTWSETYVFFGTEGVADVPGVSCATPYYAEDGSLRGVLTSSFDLMQLCSYLKELPVGENGYAFVVEFRADGDRRVIAHPDPSILLRPTTDKSQKRVCELVPPDELADARVHSFLRQLPTTLNPTELKGTTRVSFSHDGIRYLGSYHCLTSDDTPDWLVCVIVPEADVLRRVHHSNLETALVGLVILLGATLVSLCVSRWVAGPLARLAQETEAIGRLQLEPHPVAHSLVREVNRLAVAVEDTKTSLRSFRKYVPADLVRLLLSSGREATLGGQGGRVTVYFCDLADFTAVSEKLSPQDLVQHLSDYFGTFSGEILAAGGTVDKYIGDAIMAFWGAPSVTADHALAACATALRNQTALKALRGRWQAEGRPPLHARIGIHTGDVVVGNIGSTARLNYTVMGDAVNLASRLESLNKFYGTEILISEHTYREAQTGILARPVDWVSVKGKTEAVLIYELLGLKDGAARDEEVMVEQFTAALSRYRGRDWAGAIQLFEEVLRVRPDDGPAQQLIARCRAYQTRPPAEDWDGIHHMQGK